MSFILGTDKEKNKDLNLTIESRQQNVVVYGSTGSGKSRSLLVSMAMEQFKDVNAGATFICNKGDTSWLLKGFAQRSDREVVFLHPDFDKATKEFMEVGYSTGYEMQKSVLDYANAIEENKIVIIDFNVAKYRKKAKQALISMLYYLQRAITDKDESHPHYIYIDDAEITLPYIEDILTYGKEYAVGTTLFLSSYSLVEAQSRPMAYYLNANFESTIVMSRLSYEDTLYFNRRFYGNLDLASFMKRGKNEIHIERIDSGVLKVSTVLLKKQNQILLSEVEEEIDKEKLKRIKHKYPRQKGVIHSVEQPKGDIKKEFEKPKKTAKIFLSEDEFFNNL